MAGTVSIVTVNYNGFAATCEMIDSVERFRGERPVEIVVVDNASANDEARRLRDRYPRVRVAASPVNEGFAGGNNRGIACATGDYLLFLNNDTTVRGDFLTPLVERIESDPEIGVVSPQLRFEYDPDRVQYAGFTPLSAVTLRNRGLGCGERWESVAVPAGPTAFAHGAAMLVKRSVIDRVGGMPACYFLYYEEMDWCERIRRAGYTIWYEPASVVYHKESASTGADSPLKAYYMTRNRFLFARRNRNGLQRVLSIGYLAAVATPKAVARYLLRREPVQAKRCLQAMADAARGRWGKREF